MIPLSLARLSALQSEPPSYISSTTSDVVIDLSHWQGPVDFARAKSAGIAAVILKAAQGSDWIDATFAPRFATVLPRGFLVGAYHFLDDSEPALQVAKFCHRREAARCSHPAPSRIGLGVR
jgi:GH25 family lysozyme M1 (1,4-beta-N-acetylmuramidase)